MEAGRMIISALCLPILPWEKPVIMQLSADPSDFLSCHPWPSAEARGVAAAELIGDKPARNFSR